MLGVWDQNIGNYRGPYSTRLSQRLLADSSGPGGRNEVLSGAILPGLGEPSGVFRKPRQLPLLEAFLVLALGI